MKLQDRRLLAAKLSCQLIWAQSRRGEDIPDFEKRQTDNAQMQKPYVHRYRENYILFITVFKRTKHALP